MGSGSSDNPINSRMCWILTLWLTSTLEEAEREAVVGDLTESGERGGRAFTNVLGLVVRRQAAVWRDSQLWVVLLILVLPFSFLLCIVLQNAAGEGAVYTWMYADNWD